MYGLENEKTCKACKYFEKRQESNWGVCKLENHIAHIRFFCAKYNDSGISVAFEKPRPAFADSDGKRYKKPNSKLRHLCKIAIIPDYRD